VKITLSLEEKLVREVRKIAVEQGTTLTGLVREYLEKLAAQHASARRKEPDLEALESSFEKISLRIGKRTWKRDELYERN
jgi:DNA-binding GntR family transcriptional regulator